MGSAPPRTNPSWVDHEKPQLLSVSIDSIDQKDRLLERFHSLISDIPKKAARNLLVTLAASDILQHLQFDRIFVEKLPAVNKQALIIPVPDIPRFEAKPPFGNQASFTWALIHGTSIKGAQSILAENLFGPADWACNYDYSCCDMRACGTFGMGVQVGRDDTRMPDWAIVSLLDRFQKKGKGQQDMLVGGLFKKAVEHVAMKAGGKEQCQLLVTEKEL